MQMHASCCMEQGSQIGRSWELSEMLHEFLGNSMPTSESSMHTNIKAPELALRRSDQPSFLRQDSSGMDAGLHVTVMFCTLLLADASQLTPSR